MKKGEFYGRGKKGIVDDGKIFEPFLQDAEAIAKVRAVLAERAKAKELHAISSALRENTTAPQPVTVSDKVKKDNRRDIAADPVRRGRHERLAARATAKVRHKPA
jgi:hypothetical protein